MATDSDAQSLGFSTPADADFISLGDDAISENARVVTDLFNTYRMNRGTMPLNADVDAFTTERHAGLWHINSVGGAESVIGLPAEAAGQQGEFLVLQSATGVQMFFPYGYYGGPFGYVRKLLNATTDEFDAWRPWEPHDDGDLTASAQHEIRRAMFTSAMGGPIDTGGRAAVALRFDHGLANFAATVLPAVRARGITVAQAYNPRNWHRAENDGVTAADLDGWVAAGDVEIINHSANHLPADTKTALFDQIVTGLTEIEAELPAAAGKVWGFAPPGVSSGDYGGFNDGRTPKGWGTYAGRIILQHHAIGYGYLAGTSQRVLDGTPRDGQGHVTIDKQTVAGLKAMIDQAITCRTGLQLMMHPSQLDTTGALTSAQFLEVLDYIVAKRDAGELVTLSPYEMMLADSTRPPVEVGDVRGLDARLAPVEQDTGNRNINRLVPGLSAGHWTIRRAGRWVYVNLYDLDIAPTAGDYWKVSGFLPSGYQPLASSQYVHFPCARRTGGFTEGPFRVDRYGGVTIYGVTDSLVAVTAAWITDDPFPTTLPGDPA